MATRLNVRIEVKNRLGDPANAIWSDAELNGYIGGAVSSLYPTYYLRAQGTTTASAGPVQTLPAGARNIYAVDCQLVGSTRTRALLEWSEGSGTAVLPVSGIAGATLIWSWTKGFTIPGDDVTVLDTPQEAEEHVVVKTHLTALERLLSSRTHMENYRVLQTTREGVTENDVSATIRALRDELALLAAKAIPLPRIRKAGEG